MASRVNSILRKLERKTKLTYQGEVYYADVTREGAIIDRCTYMDKRQYPIALECWLPGPRAWEVSDVFKDYEQALPRAQELRQQMNMHPNWMPQEVYRLRDRRTGDIIPIDILT